MEYTTESKALWKQYLKNLLGVPNGQRVLVTQGSDEMFRLSASELGFETIKEGEGEDRIDYLIQSQPTGAHGHISHSLQKWNQLVTDRGEALCFLCLTEEEREALDRGVLPQVTKHGFESADLVKLPGLCQEGGDREWYVLRALKKGFDRETALNAIRFFWDNRADTYEEQHRLIPQEKWGENLEKLLGPRKDQKIVDIATGTGMIANFLGKLGYQDVTGMDISEGMMEIARAHEREENTGVTFCFGNALQLPLEDNSTDTLISCRLLWTLVDADTALQEWIRVTKAGGRIIALHEIEQDQPKDDAVWRHFLYGKNADPYLDMKDAGKDEYLKLFQKSGLKNVRLIHLEGCQSLEDQAERWYALVGEK